MANEDVMKWTEACESCKGYPGCPDCTCVPATPPPDDFNLDRFKVHDDADWSTVTCPCGRSFTWSGFDERLRGWVAEHTPHTNAPALTPPARPSAISIAQAVQAEQERQGLASAARECLNDALIFIELMERHHEFPVFAGELTADAILRIRSWAGQT